MLSLLYVSVSTLSETTAIGEVDALVTRAMAKNASLAITGALMFTGTEFAQALEGDENRVDALMREIYLDSRHRCVTIVRRSPITVRRFDGWSLAYSGGASYVGRPIKSLLQPNVKIQIQDVHRVQELMEGLAASLA